MGFTTLTGLGLKVPTRGTRNWDAVFLSQNQQLIASHKHTGDPDGLQLVTGSYSADSVTDGKIRLTNDGWLRARNAAGTADINIIRVNSSDVVETGAAFAGVTQTLDNSYDTGGPGAGRAITADSGPVTFSDDGIETDLIKGLSAGLTINSDHGTLALQSTGAMSLTPVGNLTLNATGGSNTLSLQDTEESATSLRKIIGQPIFDNGNETGTFALDLSAGNFQKATLTGNITTLTITNQRNGSRYRLLLIQDATGGKTISWPSEVKWTGVNPPIIDTTADAFNLFEFISDGTNLYAVEQKTEPNIVVYKGTTTGSSSESIGTTFSSMAIASETVVSGTEISRTSNVINFSRRMKIKITVQVGKFQTTSTGTSIVARIENTSDTTTLDSTDGKFVASDDETGYTFVLYADIDDTADDYEIQLARDGATAVVAANPSSTVGGLAVPTFIYTIEEVK